MNFPMGRVLDRYMAVCRVSLEEARAQETELKRFLALCALSGAKARYGIGKPIDDLWHEFILATTLYADFCKRVGGKFIHHKSRMPGVSRAESEVDALFACFQADYLRAFGAPPPEKYWSRLFECSHVDDGDQDE